MYTTSRFKKGDTIVEVLFAVAIFGFIVMSTMAIMQHGSYAAQLSLEINLARNHMNSQAEAIRFINSSIHSRERNQEAGEGNSHTRIWKDLEQRAANSVTSWDEVTVPDQGRQVCHIPDNAFVINVRRPSDSVRDRSQIELAKVFPRLIYSDSGYEVEDENVIRKGQNFIRSEGIWVEVEKKADLTANQSSVAYDFHIRSCWESPGRQTPIKLGTVVRVFAAKVNDGV